MASPEKAPVGYTKGTSFAWNTKGEVIAAAAILPFLGIVLVALRYYNRMKHNAGVGADDWLIVPAAMSSFPRVLEFIRGIGRGIVAHTTKPNPDTSKDAQLYQTTPEQEFMKKVEFIIYVIMVPAYGFIKLSVIYFYRRIFVKGTPDSRFNIVTHVTSVIVVIWTIVFFILEIFKRSSYVPDNWGLLIKAKQGINGAVLNNGCSSATLSQILGSCCCQFRWSFCAAIVRMFFNIQIVNAGLAKKTDVNMGLTTLMYWSMVEAGLSLIAANLPSVYSVFSQSASLQSTFSSLRSKLALRSFRSTDRLRGSSKEKPYEQMDASSSDGSSHTHTLALKEKESFNSNFIYTGHKMGAMPQGATVSARSDLESQCLQGKGGRAA
ncbi:MAG: hypothetical protein Q9198_003263 [Flavoplaca austrocitrina]